MKSITCHKGDLAENAVFKEMIRRAGELMEKAGLNAVLLTKPQNLAYLVGDGRLRIRNCG